MVSDTDEKALGLHDAYSLETPEDNVELYARWAETYDTEFVKSSGYTYPAVIARIYHEHAQANDAPILDVGCGTGLVAQELRAKPSFNQDNIAIDGLDISAEMLAIAQSKSVYGNLIEGNILETLEIAENTYGGVVSAGTFTLGHVGPEGLNELMRISRPNALFVIGVSEKAFEQLNFAQFLEGLSQTDTIKDHKEVWAPIYGNKDDVHENSQARVQVLRKR